MGSNSKNHKREATKVRRVSKAAALSPASTSGASTDGTNGEDLEGMISAIHEKFKRRTREQRDRAEMYVKNTISNAMQTIEQYVMHYEEQMYLAHMPAT